MADSIANGLLGNFLGGLDGDHALAVPRQMGTAQKLLLAATAIAGYAVTRYLLTALGLPVEPHISSLLLSEPVYGVIAVLVLLIVLTLIARPLVGGVRTDAPLFCAAIALLALPTAGGDARNALLDGGSGAYLTMIFEQILLMAALLAGYVALVGRPRPVDVGEVDATVAKEHDIDTMGDRLSALGVQTLVTIALLSILGQSPMKGQAIVAVALAGGLGAWITYKTRIIRGSIWYVAGTMLAGLLAYVWTSFHADGWPLGDTRGFLAGAARSLPLHYATAGVAGTIYGYWAGRSSHAETVD